MQVMCIIFSHYNVYSFLDFHHLGKLSPVFCCEHLVRIQREESLNRANPFCLKLPEVLYSHGHPHSAICNFFLSNWILLNGLNSTPLFSSAHSHVNKCWSLHLSLEVLISNTRLSWPVISAIWWHQQRQIKGWLEIQMTNLKLESLKLYSYHSQ